MYVKIKEWDWKVLTCKPFVKENFEIKLNENQNIFNSRFRKCKKLLDLFVY